MSDQSLSMFLPLLRAGDPEATERVWEYFYARIVAFANKRLVARLKRVVDGDDVAQSAFKSCFRAIHEGRAPDLKDRDHLWALLANITARKAINANVHFHTAKEGGGNVAGESVFGPYADTSNPGIQGVAGTEPPVDVVAALTEQTELLLNFVDEDSRQVAILHLQGFKDIEISSALSFSVAKVERKLRKIRSVGRRISAEAEQGILGR